MSAVSTSVASAMAQCDDQPTPKVTTHRKRRATERQACVCESSASFPTRESRGWPLPSLETEVISTGHILFVKKVDE